MAAGLRDTVGGERGSVARCTVFGVALATLLAVLCVCFGSAAHHDDPRALDAVSSSAAPMAGAGGPASAEEASLGHSCPSGDRCASVAHAAAIALPAAEPVVPTTLGEAELPTASAAAHPLSGEPVHRHIPDLHVLQVQRI
jgi:hypothetical protein